MKVPDPLVSIVMPVRNDVRYVEQAAGAVLDQDVPGGLELILAVGPSGDGTEDVCARLAQADERVSIVENPDGSAAAGLNRAVASAAGAVLARVDARAVVPPGYLRRAVELLEVTGADVVGGMQQPRGTTPFEEAVAAAMSSRFGAGDARYRTGGEPGPTDTVYLGVFRRDAFERAGGFDESLVRNQDYELNYRLRARGGVVYFHPDLRVAYRPRSSLRALCGQYFQYGQWKQVVVRRHPRSLRWRQLAAPAMLVANTAGVVVGLTRRRGGLAVPGAYLMAVLGASALVGRNLPPRAAASLPGVFVTMHGAWGLGFLVGPRGPDAPSRQGCSRVPRPENGLSDARFRSTRVRSAPRRPPV
ncbi:MAG TPA: glycosyltransferase family 2 protein [Egibacteraceae bacterium]|nr:glycosyltransferase family 2 protein [Egibacteraceae bacterium]